MNSKRSCGPCRACCIVPPIGAPLDKPARTPCRNLRAAGCGIYRTRPDVCRGFSCMWLDGLFGSNARPDKLGVIFELRAQSSDEFSPGQPTVTVREVWKGAAEDVAKAFPGPWKSLLKLYPVCLELFPGSSYNGAIGGNKDA